jgi:LmbE family N-acetylglucosaminyl deacetylase
VIPSQSVKPNQSPLSRAAAAMTCGWSDDPSGRRLIRKLLSRSVRFAITARSRPLSTKGMNAVLAIAPHPDDEALGCGGTLAILKRENRAVHIGFVTDGAASHPAHPIHRPEAIAAIRRREALAAAHLLGIAPSELHFLNAPDGSLQRLPLAAREDLIARISALLTLIKPDAVLLPSRNDGSSEHNAAFILVDQAIKKTALTCRVLEYPVWAWRNPLLLAGNSTGYRNVWKLDLGDLRFIKAAAIDAYASQTRPIPPDLDAVLPEDFTSEFKLPDELIFER